MSEFRTRFAPSPTGYLHLGHAYSALLAHDMAKAAKGEFLLRIEDIDQGRCRNEFEDAIYEDLSWLGVTWEPDVRRQSEHFSDYDAALQGLIDKGLVYRCFKTRKEIADEISRAPHLSPDGPEGPQYVGAPFAAYEERSLLAEGAPFAWRLSMQQARKFLGAQFKELSFVTENIDDPKNSSTHHAAPEIFGDVIVARKDSGTSYHLASIFDDALQNVTHVIRGDDLRAAAHLHRLLQALLDLPPIIYRHHKLITDERGKRLAKRDKSITIRALRESGETRASIRERLGLSAA